MDILYVLVPLSLVAMFGVIGVFAWALQNDQFDDLEGEGAYALQLADAPRAPAATDGTDPAAARLAFDADQARVGDAREQSPT